MHRKGAVIDTKWKRGEEHEREEAKLEEWIDR